MTQYNFESIFAGNSDFLSNAKFSGGLNLESTANVQEIFEKVCVYKDTAYNELVIDLGKGSLHNYSGQSTGNFTFNITGLRGIPKEKSIVVTVLINMGSSAYVYIKPNNNWI